MVMVDEFAPGAYWTDDRKAAAVRRMSARLASPEMQAMMAASVEEAHNNDAPPADDGAAPPPSVDPATILFRRGREDDIGRFAELMVRAHLPPLFVDEFIEGFVAVESGGEVIGCGGLEVYGESGVLRSIVIDERVQGLGLGRKMSELLMEDARLSGVTDLYLFTVDAWAFWKRLGFDDVALEAWKGPPRAGWQYAFISRHPEAVAGIHSMWRRV